MSSKHKGYVVFSDDWGVHPSSCQHLFLRISATQPVLWVNTIGLRDPDCSLRDLRKAASKLRRMLFSRVAPEEAAQPVVPAHSPRVCQPFMLPFARFRAVRAFNRWSVIRTVEQTVADMGLIDPVIVSTVPNACDYAGAFPSRRLVYYCVDDFSLWPGHDITYIKGLEAQLIDRAEVLVATSSALCERLALSGKPTHLLHHGVDISHFSRREHSLHPLLAAIPGIKVGYFGLLDERLDQALLQSMARQQAELQFVLMGPQAVAMQALAALPNVHFTGPVPYGQLPSVVSGLSVLLLPYKSDALGQSLSPLKLREYLATGLPVISSPLRDAEAYGSLIRFAEGSDAWCSALRDALHEVPGNRLADVRQALAGQDWSDKAAELQAWCQE